MKNKINSLQAIRAFAFFGIFASHSGIEAFSACGAWGVSVFIILSGFLMYLAYGQSDRIQGSGISYSFKFGVEKVRRLYPLHIVTMFLAIPTLFLGQYDHSGIWKVISPFAKIFSNVLLIQSWEPKKEYYFSLNAVSWYLSLSLFLYMMFPVILKFMKRYDGLKSAIISTACVFSVQILLSYISFHIQAYIRNEDFFHWFTYVFPISRLEDFFIGCNLGYIFSHRDVNSLNRCRHTPWETGIFIVIIFQWAFYWFQNKKIENVNYESIHLWWGGTVFWTISSCALVYIFALNRGVISSFLSNKILVSIGNMSANAFLIHLLVYKYIREIEMIIWGVEMKYLNFFVCFFISIICAYVWELIDKNIKFAKSRAV